MRLTVEPRVMLTTPGHVVDGAKLGIDPFMGVEFTADGKSVIVVQARTGDRPTTIGVIENWYEEFKARQ